MTDIIVAYADLLRLCSNKLIEAGVKSEEAAVVAEVLVHADLRGVHSHGVMRTSHYVNRVKAGGINLLSVMFVNETGPVTAIVDGDDGFGHVISKYAMEEAIRLARINGVGMVGAVNSSHCGALSYYVRQAAEEGMIGMAMANADGGVVPFGGRESFFGTNPIAFGFPAKVNKPIIIDMATSTVAWGKIMHAKETGQSSIPADWGVDANGKPTDDPNQVRTLLPVGGAKGYGLGMVVDIFSGVLMGAAFGPHVASMYGSLDRNRKLAHYFCVIHPSAFTDPDPFLDGIDQMIAEIHSLQPAEGINRVLVPGEPEQLLEEERLVQGIPVTPSVYQYLRS